MSIDAGSLRHRVRIEAREDVQDPDTGAVTPTWVQQHEVWAKIEHLSVREALAAQATQSKVTARITIRYRPGMMADMRLVHVRDGYPNVTYYPHGFLADKESGVEYLTMPASEGVDEF